MNPANYEPWWQSLDDAHRSEALDVDGALPDWMIHSLDVAGIFMADVEFPDGSTGRMMSTRFREFLQTKG